MLDRALAIGRQAATLVVKSVGELISVAEQLRRHVQGGGDSAPAEPDAPPVAADAAEPESPRATAATESPDEVAARAVATPKPEPRTRIDGPPTPPEPPHIDTEDELVGEFAETGAEDGAGAQIEVAEPWS